MKWLIQEYPDGEHTKGYEGKSVRRVEMTNGAGRQEYKILWTQESVFVTLYTSLQINEFVLTCPV